MYFQSRAQAGGIIAAQLTPKYRYDDCIVIALSDGAVLIGEQIATGLHCPLSMLLIQFIEVPGESLDFGGITSDGVFTFNGMFSAGEINEYVSEYHGYLEEQKREAIHNVNRLLGDGGLIDPEMVRDRVVIFVADGVDDGTVLDVALDFIKPIRVKKTVFVTPVASVPGVDRLHMAGDEIHVLDVKENFMGTDHYYDDNTIPSHEETIAKINQIILNWH